MSVWSELRHWTHRTENFEKQLTRKLQRVSRLSRKIDPSGYNVAEAKRLLTEAATILDHLQECDYHRDKAQWLVDFIGRCNEADRQREGASESRTRQPASVRG